MIKTWVGAIAWKIENRDLWFLVQDCISIDSQYLSQGVQIKFPGGGKKGKDRDVLAALIREVKEETGLILTSGNYKPCHDKITDDRRKIFYLLSYRDFFRGTLRTEPILDGDTLLGPPRWMKVCRWNEQFIYHTHRQAWQKAVTLLQVQGLKLVV